MTDATRQETRERIAIEPSDKAVTVAFHDAVIASTRRAIVLTEKGHDPAFYGPAGDARPPSRPGRTRARHDRPVQGRGEPLVGLGRRGGRRRRRPVLRDPARGRGGHRRPHGLRSDALARHRRLTLGRHAMERIAAPAILADDRDVNNGINIMRKLLLIGVAAFAMAGSAAQAQEAQGAAAGAAVGAGAGALVGGPVGAVVGGVIGFGVGGAASVPDDVRTYVVANPVETVTVEGELSEGMVLPESVILTPVEGSDEFAYIYADGRPVVVRASDRAVVYAPASVTQDVVTYVDANPVEELQIEGELVVGDTAPETVTLTPLPDADGYSYFYANGRPYIVADSNRQVIYVR